MKNYTLSTFAINSEADTRLVAVAHELLEALEALTLMAEFFPSELHKDHPDVITARAALAKATGEQNENNV